MFKSGGRAAVRWFGAAAVMASLAAAIGVATAPAASAATIDITVECGAYSFETSSFPVTEISVSPGDVVNVYPAASCDLGVSRWVSNFAMWVDADEKSAIFENTDGGIEVPGVFQIKADAPLGTMSSADSDLPYVCKECATGQMLRFTVVASGGTAAGASATTATYTLTSSADARGTCWSTVSGLAGTWVQLTDSGCAAPAAGATLLGWATSSNFPVVRAKDGVVVDEEFGGVRMIFIPVNGYTFLSGDNTLYPIWNI